MDGEGTVWVGSEHDRYDGAALSGFGGKGWLTYTLRSNTGYSNVAALAVAADGTPWAVAYNPAQFSTTSTLFRLDVTPGTQQVSPAHLWTIGLRVCHRTWRAYVVRH